jgi:arylformamidase
MPYFIGGNINSSIPGLWGEGNPYQASTIYDILSTDPKLPPVNYQSHTIKPHSLTHVDAASHIIIGADAIDAYFHPDRSQCFYGETLVVKLEGAKWQDVPGDKNTKLWRITRDELESQVFKITGTRSPPTKIIVAPKEVATTKDGYHNPDFIFVLSVDAANWLVQNPNFNLFGTSWKSSDFEPGSRERPVHRILLQQALLLEYVVVSHVPAGKYFMIAVPLNLGGASESPVNPILFEAKEIYNSYLGLTKK